MSFWKPKGKDGGSIGPQQSGRPFHNFGIANMRQTLIALRQRHFPNLLILVLVRVDKRLQIIRPSHRHDRANSGNKHYHISIAILLRESEDIAGADFVCEVELMLQNRLFFDLPVLLQVYSVQNQGSPVQTDNDVARARLVAAAVEGHHADVCPFEVFQHFWLAFSVV